MVYPTREAAEHTGADGKALAPYLYQKSAFEHDEAFVALPVHMGHWVAPSSMGVVVVPYLKPLGFKACFVGWGVP
jgi:hypothetical protein